MKAALEVLIRLSEEKKSLLSHICEDCMTQHANISSSNLDGIEYLINRREEYMRRIERVDEEYFTSVERCKAKSGVSDLKDCGVSYPEEWKRLQELSAEIRELCVGILKEDKVNGLAMENMIADSRSELKQVKDGQRLNQAYYPLQGEEGSRIDDSF